MFPPGSEPGEQRKEHGFGSRLRQSDGLLMVENSQPSANPKQGGSARGRRKRERELNEMMEKGGSTPPYIGQGGLPPSSNFPCGTKPKGRGGGAPYGGWAPPLAPWTKGGGSLLPLMGPKGPICLFPI